METDSYKLMGSAVGHHGPYAFYKALRINRKGCDQIIAIGDFFFVKLWQDSELMAIGELQLLWTDRAAGRTLASLRIYFLPENTPAGRAHHGEDEVVGISERVVIRAEELLTWVNDGRSWRWGLRAMWGGPAPPKSPNPTKQDNLTPSLGTQDHNNEDTPKKQSGDEIADDGSSRLTADTLTKEKDSSPALNSSSSNAPITSTDGLDFSDIDKEKSAIVDVSAPCVVVFSYPRYCRYRAMMRRLEGLGEKWVRDPVVIALGGYVPPTADTRILYCRETFEYPELEGHEFVCNHMAPRLKGRGVRGRKRLKRSISRSSASDSEASHHRPVTPQLTRSIARAAACASPSSPTVPKPSPAQARAEERSFMQRLRLFQRSSPGTAQPNKTPAISCKELNLHQLYTSVIRNGGYEAVTRVRGWRRLIAGMGAPSAGSQATLARRHYERFLLPFEKSERRSGQSTPNGTSSNSNTPTKPERKKHLANIANNSVPIATIDISDSPVREINSSPTDNTKIPRLRTPPPTKRKPLEPKKVEQNLKVLSQNGDKRRKSQEVTAADKTVLKDNNKIKNIKDDSRVINLVEDTKDVKKDSIFTDEEDETVPENNFDPSNILNLDLSIDDKGTKKEDDDDDYVKVSKAAADLNQEFLDSLPKAEVQETIRRSISVVPPEKLMHQEHAAKLTGIGGSINGAANQLADKGGTPARSRPASSLRSVRVKPDRRHTGAHGSSPPAVPPSPSLSAHNHRHTNAPSHNNTSSSNGPPSDDDLIEVPYRPKSPEIIDLDLYESPESPQSSAKRKKLDILKRGGLEVTAVQGWPGLDPAFQQQIMNQAQILQMYGAFGHRMPPKVTQAKSIYGSSSPEKTVYGNPKDPFMPPPHILQGAAPRRVPCVRTPTGAEVLDLTVRPAVEIVRVPTSSDQPQNLSSKKNLPINNCTLSNSSSNNHQEPRQINSALEITLVAARNRDRPPRPPQKRSSSGKFMSNKSSSGQSHSSNNISNAHMGLPSLGSTSVQAVNSLSSNSSNSSNSSSRSQSKNVSHNSHLVIPNYQVSSTSGANPSSIASNLLQSAGGVMVRGPSAPPLLDTSLYMSALYGSIAEQLVPGLADPHKLALYSELLASGLLSGAPVPPTSKS